MHFGFARFDKVKDVRLFGTCLDKIIIGRDRIFVNLSRFKKEERARRHQVYEERTYLHRTDQVNKDQRSDQTKTSYAQVVHDGGETKQKNEEGAITTLLEDARGWMEQWVKEIRPRSVKEMDTELMVWLRVYGIPAHT
ncbi:hypothetical protein A2U01_0004575 [Trifolium medium]|uniref:Uncharacterized protein n=1 Tax=Trifolium medium TaxID=97028 RepID=A0A392M962_9FABA|nr:hypothetical protein [Trifolium medium]